MNTVLIPERLIKSRKLLGLNKAEAARLLNLSKMGYGRYESGERSPSFQTIVSFQKRIIKYYQELQDLTQKDTSSIC